MQVGTTKDQGLYIKPSAAVHPGALAAGTLLQYNTTVSTLHIPTFMSRSLIKYGDNFITKPTTVML